MIKNGIEIMRLHIMSNQLRVIYFNHNFILAQNVTYVIFLLTDTVLIFTRKQGKTPKEENG
jgi:hypothetical protein